VSLSFAESAPAIVMGLQLGVADHLIKPVDLKSLVKVTRELKLSLTLERKKPHSTHAPGWVPRQCAGSIWTEPVAP
jgi:YesN/AraC family two-component response regulator